MYLCSIRLKNELVMRSPALVGVHDPLSRVQFFGPVHE